MRARAARYHLQRYHLHGLDATLSVQSTNCVAPKLVVFQLKGTTFGWFTGTTTCEYTDIYCTCTGITKVIVQILTVGLVPGHLWDDFISQGYQAPLTHNIPQAYRGKTHRFQDMHPARSCPN